MMINLSLIAILTISGVHSMKDGRPVNIGEFPYVVSIRYYMIPLCSGTIIDERHILTTAHTVESRPSSSLFVVTGMVTIRFPCLRLLLVSDVVVHPGYKQIILSLDQNDPYWDNDIALLLLTEPLVWDSTIARAPLSTAEAVSHRCFECAMVSWNYLEDHNSSRLILMWEAVHILDNAPCNQWGISVSLNQHCFADLFETAFISFEDIGSPIICGNSMVGFIARGGKNGITSSPSTFLSIINYTGFIADVINGSQVKVQSGEYPYVSSIWVKSRFLCTGTIINSYQVMTVEHCLRATTGYYDRRSLKIAVGLTDVWNLDRTISYFYIHDIISPVEDPGRKEHNIVLLKIDRPFVWSPAVQSLRLAEVENFSTQQFCQLIFWKRGNEAIRMFPETRKMVKLHLVLIASQMLNWQLGAYQFAAKSPTSADFSMVFIESGSPIICRGHPLGLLVGVDLRIASFPYMIFHRIHPYFDTGFITLN